MNRERLVAGAAARPRRRATGRRAWLSLVVVAFGFAACPPFASAGSATSPSWSFASNPNVHPVRVKMLKNSRSTAPGYIFVAPIGNIGVKHSVFYGQKGPLILDGAGNPVWQGTVPPNDVAMNFEPQRYRGQSVLTWWQGMLESSGVGNGQDVIVDDHYAQVATLSAQKGWSLDPHEFTITPQGTALFIEDKPVRRDLSAYGGSKHGAIFDDVVVEEDIRTHRVLHRWDALQHLGLGESYGNPPSGRPWDVFHMNSVAVGPGGTLLISVRNNSALYSVARHGGRIYWRLGGKHSNFKIDSGARFARQHDARYVNRNEITVFDNDGPPGIHPMSRGLTIRLDIRRHTARLVHGYPHPRPPLLVGSQGSDQLLPNGDTFVGWGQAPYVSEFSRSGALLLDFQFPGRDESYRSFRAQWSGQPTWSPSLAVHISGGSAVAYASWNGSTQVASWEILAGATPDTLVPAGNASRTGFETAVNVSNGGPYFQAQALDGQGHELAASAVVQGS